MSAVLASLVFVADPRASLDVGGLGPRAVCMVLLLLLLLLLLGLHYRQLTRQLPCCCWAAGLLGY